MDIDRQGFQTDSRCALNKLAIGPIENRVALAPEQPPGEPGVMRWSLDSGTMAYMKCRYRNSRHYLVLVAEGATHCIARMAPEQLFQASCSGP
ncbi:STY0301 family protein [Achromobacter arsenitoxydans]|uniref:STY0301 family protein n=1 Tax=Achromobacter arsenitoxydans TaxID=1147684 RepID=UPI003082973F